MLWSAGAAPMRHYTHSVTGQQMAMYWFCCVAMSVILMVEGTTTDLTFAQPRTAAPSDTSDEELVRRLPGFHNAYAEVNGIRLHYVEGGQGQPLILLPGWPQTWWQFSR